MFESKVWTMEAGKAGRRVLFKQAPIARPVTGGANTRD